jgi:hypothetical protein
MIVKMALALPFFKEMHNQRRIHISCQFVPRAAFLAANDQQDLPDFNDKFLAPFRHQSNPCINNNHREPKLPGKIRVAFLRFPCTRFSGHSLITFRPHLTLATGDFKAGSCNHGSIQIKIIFP